MDIKELNNFICPKEANLGAILWVILVAMFVNSLTDIFSVNMGIYLTFALNVFGLILMPIAIITNKRQKERRIRNINKLQSLEIDSLIKSKKLIKPYKGLIASVSNPPYGKTKDVWVNECKEIINNAIKNNNIDEVTTIIGIGQTFKAINYHFGELKYCWLIYSKESDFNVDIINYFFDKTTNKSLKPTFVKINDSNDSKHIKEIIDNIYDHLPEELNETDVIADITAGNKPMTAGMILSCLDPERNIEYVEQSKERTLIEIDISPKFKGLKL